MKRGLLYAQMDCCLAAISPKLETLRVVVVGELASASGGADGAASPAVSSTLSVLAGRAASRASGSRGYR
jgi:hypothetical protein